MNFIYPFIISFMLVFFSELGDKTQLLVLSFSTKDKAKNILLGVAIGTFFSHGLAVLFGSKLGSLGNQSFIYYSKIITYASFLLFGIIGFIPKKHKNTDTENKKSNSILHKITNIKISMAKHIISGVKIDSIFAVFIPYLNKFLKLFSPL